MVALLLLLVAIRKATNLNPIIQADTTASLLLCDKNVTNCVCSNYVIGNISCTEYQLSGNQNFDSIDIQDKNVPNYYFVFSGDGGLNYEFGSSLSSLTLIGETSVVNIISYIDKYYSAYIVLDKVLLKMNNEIIDRPITSLKYINGGKITNPGSVHLVSYLDVSPQEYYDNYQGLNIDKLQILLFNNLNDKNHHILFKKEGFLIDRENKFYNLSKNSFTTVLYFIKSKAIAAETDRTLTIEFETYIQKNIIYFDIQLGSLIVNLSRVAGNTVNCYSNRNDALIFDPFIQNSFYYSDDESEALFLSSEYLIDALICFGKGQCIVPDDKSKKIHTIVLQKQLNSLLTAISTYTYNDEYSYHDVALIGTSNEIEVDISHADFKNSYLLLGNNISHCTYTINNSAEIQTRISLFNSTLKMKSGIKFNTKLINVTMGSIVENIDQIQTEGFIIQKLDLPKYQTIKTKNLTYNGLSPIKALENNISLSNGKIKFNDELFDLSNISAERFILAIPIKLSDDISKNENIQCNVKLESELITRPPSLYLYFDDYETENFVVIKYEGSWSHVTNNPLMYYLSHKYIDQKSFPFKYARYHLDKLDLFRYPFLYDQHPITVPSSFYFLCMDDKSYNLPSRENTNINCSIRKKSLTDQTRIIRSNNDLDQFFSDLQAVTDILSISNYLTSTNIISLNFSKMPQKAKIRNVRLFVLATLSNISVTTPSVPPIDRFDLYSGNIFSFIEPNNKRITINTINFLNRFYDKIINFNNSIKIVGNFQEIQKAMLHDRFDVESVTGLYCQQVVAEINDEKDEKNSTIIFIDRGFNLSTMRGNQAAFNINEKSIWTNNFSFLYYIKNTNYLVFSLDPSAASTAMSVEIDFNDKRFQIIDFSITFDQSFKELKKDISILFSGNNISKYFTNNPSSLSDKLHIFSDKDRDKFEEYKRKDDIPINTPTSAPTIIPTRDPDYVEPEKPEEMAPPIQSNKDSFDISNDIIGDQTSNKPIVVEFTKKDISIKGNISSNKDIYFTPTIPDSKITIEGVNDKDFGNATYGVKITKITSTIVIQTTKVPLNILSEDEETELILNVSPKSDSPGETNQNKIELNKLTIGKSHFILYLPSTFTIVELANINLYQTSSLSIQHITSFSNILSHTTNQHIHKMKEDNIKIMTDLLELKIGSNTIVDEIELSNKVNINEGSKLTVNDELILNPGKTNIAFKITSNVNLVSVHDQNPIIKFSKCSTYPLNISISIVSSHTPSKNSALSFLGIQENMKNEIKLVCGDSFSTCSNWKDIITESTNYKHNECQMIEKEQCLIIRNFEPSIENGKKLKSGEIAGIVIGCIAFAGIIIGIVVYFVVIRKKETNSSDNGTIGRDNSTKL